MSSGADQLSDELQRSLRTLFRGGGLAVAGAVLRRLFGIISIIIFTTFLGAGGFGAYMLLFGAVTIMSVIAAMGLAPGTMRFVVQKRAEGRADQVLGLVRTASRLGFASSVVVVLVGWVLAGPIVTQIFHQPEQVGLLRWMTLAVPASVLCLLWLHATKGFHRMEETFWVSDFFDPAVRISLFLLFVLGGIGLLGAAVSAYIGAAVASAVLARLALRRLVPPGPVRTEPGEVWALLSFSLPLLGAGAVGMIMEWTDTMMLGYFTATSQVGVYNVALRVAALSVMVHLAFTSIFAPISADLLQRNKMESLDQLLKIDTRWVFTLTLPIFVLVVLLSRDILVIFGPEFMQGGVALMVLTSALFFNACTGSCGAIIRMSGRTRLAFANNCVAGVLNVLLNLLLIPRLGILGAALATGASIVVVNALRLVQVWWLFKLSPYDRKWVKPVVAGLSGSLAVAGLQKIAPVASPAWNLAVSAGVFSLCYAGLLLLQRLEREDKLMLRLLRARVFGGA
ncbi:MAG: flippase [bacterium]|nr:flippase [bacterium]